MRQNHSAILINSLTWLGALSLDASYSTACIAANSNQTSRFSACLNYSYRIMSVKVNFNTITDWRSTLMVPTSHEKLWIVHHASRPKVPNFTQTPFRPFFRVPSVLRICSVAAERRVALKKGVPDALKVLQEHGITCNIVSVNWSREVIQNAMDGQSDIEIFCNDLQFSSSNISTGGICRSAICPNPAAAGNSITHTLLDPSSIEQPRLLMSEHLT